MAERPLALLENKVRNLASDWGYEWALKLFGKETIDSLPRIRSGPNKGKPRGFVHWRKADRHGWCQEINCLVFQGIVDAWIAPKRSSYRHEALLGRWAGREQILSLTRDQLFDKGHYAAIAQDQYYVRSEAARAKAMVGLPEGTIAPSQDVHDVERYWALVKLCVGHIFQEPESLVDDVRTRLRTAPDFKDDLSDLFFHPIAFNTAADIAGRDALSIPPETYWEFETLVRQTFGDPPYE